MNLLFAEHFKNYFYFSQKLGKITAIDPLLKKRSGLPKPKGKDRAQICSQRAGAPWVRPFPAHSNTAIG